MYWHVTAFWNEIHGLYRASELPFDDLLTAYITYYDHQVLNNRST